MMKIVLILLVILMVILLVSLITCGVIAFTTTVTAGKIINDTRKKFKDRE